jgi:predicted metal-dependent HD superfamily phosphohydrolase
MDGKPMSNILIQSLDCANVPEHVRDMLFSAYREPNRHYHNLAHIGFMLNICQRYASLHRTRDDFLLTIWFHDLVIDKGSDNEDLSAMQARLWVEEGEFCLLDNIVDAIRATKYHICGSKGQTFSDMICDLDLAILAARPARYDWYARMIRREYGYVPSQEYRDGRIEFLEKYRERSDLFKTQVLAATGYVYSIDDANNRMLSNTLREIDMLRSGIIS